MQIHTHSVCPVSNRISFRAAREDEKDYLQQRLAETEHEQVSLEHCWVAEQDGKVLGMLPARLVLQLEPLYLFPEVTNRMTRSRAALGMYIAAENWIASDENAGPKWFMAVTRSAAVKRWSKRLEWYRQYKGAATYIKYV